MASYGRHTLAMISAGFSEFSRTTADYVARVPIFHRLVAAGTMIISTILIGFFQIRGRMLKVAHGSNVKDEGIFQKLKKSKVVKGSLNAVDRLLSIIENLIIPSILNEKKSPKVVDEISVPEASNVHHEMNGVPRLLNLRHVSNSNGGTPCNQQKPSDTAEDNWTPFSSVSAVDESVFDRSCVSLMEDLSQSTISTPIRDLRQQMASKIRTWRLAIRDLEGTPEFPNWSPESTHRTRKSNLINRIWNSLAGWLPIRLTGSDHSTIPGSGRKRKRMDADDDDLALYIPHHKGQSKLNGRAGLVGTEAAEQPALPCIRGLSVVPIIGNWFSAEPTTESEETRSSTEMQLDHISLIQRDFISPSKQTSDSASDSEAYEILEIETKNTREDTSLETTSPIECP